MTNALVLTPILIPLAGAFAALLIRRRQRLQAGWTLGVMVVTLICGSALFRQVWLNDAPLVVQLGGWSAPSGISLVADLLAALLVVMTQLVMTMGVIYALGSQDKVIRFPTFYPFFLALAAGLSGAFLTGDLFNLFVFAELTVISGTMLTAAADDRFGAEAAYKYFYISLMASFMMLLGIGCLYVSYGTLNMADLALRIAADGSRPLLWPAIAFLMVTFMIKGAAFPFHFWQPDFHAAAPTAVSAMLSSVVVKLGVYGFLRMTTLLFIDQAPTIRAILLGVGLVGVAFGGLAAVGSHNVKRMLAYSTLAQVGFILVGVAWGTPLALAAAVVFIFNHSLIKAALLMLAGYVASRAAVKSAAFQVVTGVGRALPGAGVLFFAGSLALAGIPPTSGFVSKMLLFNSGLNSERFWSLLFIGLASILTLVYAMRAFGRIWWQRESAAEAVKPTGDRLLAPALLVGLILVLGLWAEPLVRAADAISTWLGDPAIYIGAVLGG